MPPTPAQEKWRSSGITDNQAKRLKLISIPDPKTLSPTFHSALALRIPYFNLKGKPTGFYRIRYLAPLPGFAGQVEKPQRYDQLPGTLNEVYLPPLLKTTWQVVCDDADTSVLVTEGELKAARGCNASFPTIGLGGVNTFKSTKAKIAFLPQLEAFAWEGRHVYIVFDNDITHKIEVLRAQRALAKELTSRGARVFLVDLPAGPAKGLDDYLQACGAAALQALLDDARPFDESEALWGMNEELVFIRTINTVIERPTAMPMKPFDFTASIYANRYYMEQEEQGPKGKKYIVLVKKPLAPAWLKWEKRAQLERLTYAPAQPKVFGDAWNAWNGWGCEPVKGDVAPWHFLMDFLFDRNDKMRQWFERWCAYPLQHPESPKMYTAVLLWSRVKRLGKSFVTYALRDIYGKNAVVINSKDLKGGFNYWGKDRQLIIGEEITAGEARVDADYLKGIITQSHITIKAKFMADYTTPDMMNHIYTSNHMDALFLEDGDGRFAVHEVKRQAPAPRAEYEKADKWLKGTGPSHLFHYLLNLDLGDFNPREHAPDSADKQAMIRMSKNDLGLWVEQLKEDPVTALKVLGEKASKDCDLFTPSMLYRAFDPERRGRAQASEAALGRALSAGGFRQINGNVPLVTESGTHRLYAVRNIIRWEQATRKEAKAHFNEFHGRATLGELK